VVNLGCPIGLADLRQRLTQAAGQVRLGGQIAGSLGCVEPLTVDVECELPETARWSHHPAVITKVSLHDSTDRGTSEAGERPLQRVVASWGLQQTAAGSLTKVVWVFTASVEAAGDGVGEPEMIKYEIDCDGESGGSCADRWSELARESLA
jgi:hypothetical protein